MEGAQVLWIIAVACILIFVVIAVGMLSAANLV